MKQSTILVIFFICLFFFKNETYGQSTTVTIQYSGFTTQCCSASSVNYYCFNSPDNVNYCGGTVTCNSQTFMDPVPAGNIVTKILVTFYSAGCAGGTMTGTLNGVVVGSSPEVNNGCLCSNTIWAATGSATANYPCGITNAGYPYNYGANNTFQFCASGGQICIDRVILTIYYVPANQATPATQPGSISGNAAVCVGTANTYSIPAVANASGYTWTVPAGWTINSGQNTTSITATPGSAGNICVTANNLCGTSVPTCFPVTINTSSTAPTGASATPNPICAGASTTLSVSGGVLGLGASWNWYSGSCGGTFVGTGSSISVSPGATTTYYVRAQGSCNTTACQSVVVTVNPNVTPTFTAVSPICSGAVLAALPTTSTNGITGTWSPAINNTATTTYTFTPSAGQCATTTTLTITVNPNVTPTFTAVAPICSGAALAALPTTSTNGITGTWSPAINNTATTTYTFTPTAGQCATTTTLTITVNPNITPTFTAVAPICSGAALAALPTTSTNGITGTWSPVLNNTATTTYTFTPTAGQCATTTTLTITVNPNVTPTFTAVSPICSGAALAALPTTSTNGITGTWSPAINNTATTTYTFTPTAGQCATTTTLSITVNPNVTPTFTAVAPICSGAALAALPTTSTNGITGTWSPAINNTATTTYTFTPTAGQCATTTTLTITVNPNDNASFSYTSNTYCITGLDPVATVSGTTGGTFTISSPGVLISSSTGEIDLSASGLGVFTVYYNTSSAGNLCPVIDSTVINITSAPSAVFNYDVAQYCQDASAPVLTFGVGASAGVFSSTPVGLTLNPSNGAVTLSTSTAGVYTVYNNIAAAGGCAASIDSTTIEVLQIDDASFSYVTGNTYCITGTDPVATASGTSGGTYSISSPGVLLNTATGEIDLSASGLGSFIVYYNTISAGNACPQIDSVTVDITDAPTAGFSYDAAQYCQDATNPILTMSPGASLGTFSSTPAGLNLNTTNGAVTLPSTAGIYTVYNTIAAAGGCAVSIDSTTIEVLQLDDASFSYVTGNTYCITGTDPVATASGTSGGTYSISTPGVLLNTATGEIDLSASGLGTFTVYYNTTSAGNACPQIDSVTINVVNAPGASFTYNTPFCEGNPNPSPIFVGNNFPGGFSSNPSGVNFVSTSTGEIDLSTTVAGTYMIYNNLVASGGCAAALDSFEITINPSYNIQETVAVCSGGSYTFPDGTTQANITVQVIYNSNLTTGLGCDSIVETTVNVNPTPFTQEAANVCSGGSYTFPDGTTQTNITTQVVYNSTLISSLGCDSIVETTVSVNPIPTVSVTNGGLVCSGSTINFTPSTGGTWSSSNPTVASIDNTGLVTGLSVGTTNMVFTETSTGCQSTVASGLVMVGGVTASIGATPSSGMMPLEVVFTNGSTTGPTVTYTWDFGDGTPTSNQFVPTHTYANLGNYTATLTVSDGFCSASASIIIEVIGKSSILIPNVFTPNNDGSNDVFTVEGTNLESVEAEIFNRWGQKMYEWKHIKGYWDGRTQSGSGAPDGTYFYIIKAKGLDGEEYFKKGGFNLIR